jgi:hypothetical protein
MIVWHTYNLYYAVIMHNHSHNKKVEFWMFITWYNISYIHYNKLYIIVMISNDVIK